MLSMRSSLGDYRHLSFGFLWSSVGFLFGLSFGATGFLDTVFSFGAYISRAFRLLLSVISVNFHLAVCLRRNGGSVASAGLYHSRQRGASRAFYLFIFYILASSTMTQDSWKTYFVVQGSTNFKSRLAGGSHFIDRIGDDPATALNVWSILCPGIERTFSKPMQLAISSLLSNVAFQLSRHCVKG